MKNIDKIAIKYKGDELPDNFLEAIKNADEEDLRVLLAAILLEQKKGEAYGNSVCEGLDIDQGTLGASLKYWRGAGFVGRSRKSSESKKTQDKKTEVSHTHKNGKTQSASELPRYTTSELTALMERRKITADFISEAQRVYGKIFNQAEVEIVLRMIDYVGFDEECVLTLLSFYSKPERKSVRYIEKAALDFYDEEINTVEALQEKLRAIENARSLEGKIRAMFGMGGRSLTTKEKKYISAWTEKMGFDLDMIRLAYDITVDKTHEATPAYANAILERWYADGIDTLEKAEAASDKHAEQKIAEGGKSFDNDDFFEAALRRSYKN